MASPVIDATAYVQTTGAISSPFAHDVTIPTGTGGKLVLFLNFDAVPTVSNMPAGWVNKYSVVNGTVCKAECWEKADEGDTDFQFNLDSNEHSQAKCARISGAHADEIEVATFTSVSNSTTPDPPELDMAEDGLDYLMMAYFAADLPQTVSDFPDGYDDNQDAQNSGGGGAGITMGFCSKETTAIGSDDPNTFTKSHVTQWIAATAAAKPAGGGAQQATAGIASSTASALAPTGTGSGSAPATAGIATSAASALNATATGSGSAPATAGIATSAATALDASAVNVATTQQVTAGIATSTATAPDATGTGAGSAPATAGIAASTASAPDATSTGAGSAPATAGIAASTATALDVTAANGVQSVTAGIASVNASALAVVAAGSGAAAATAGIATVAATALAPTTSQDAIVQKPAGRGRWMGHYRRDRLIRLR